MMGHLWKTWHLRNITLIDLRCHWETPTQAHGVRDGMLSGSLRRVTLPEKPASIIKAVNGLRIWAPCPLIRFKFLVKTVDEVQRVDWDGTLTHGVVHFHDPRQMYLLGNSLHIKRSPSLPVHFIWCHCPCVMRTPWVSSIWLWEESKEALVVPPLLLLQMLGMCLGMGLVPHPGPEHTWCPFSPALS